MMAWSSGRQLLLLFALAGCSRPDAAPVGAGATIAEAFDGRAGEWVDLTHPYDEATICWPSARPFKLEVVARGMTDGGYFYAANDFSMAEHCGTHIDAPIHFAEGAPNTNEIPVSALIGPAAVVDVSRAAAANPDYQLSVEDLARWEREHGRLADGVILLIRTGWHTRWRDRAAYLGTALSGAEAVAQLHFPSVSSAAGDWLVANRRLKLLGIDTPSADLRPPWKNHVTLSKAKIPMLENVAALGRLPSHGAYVVALPMSIARGSGGPVRIAAFLPARSR